MQTIKPHPRPTESTSSFNHDHQVIAMHTKFEKYGSSTVILRIQHLEGLLKNIFWMSNTRASNVIDLRCSISNKFTNDVVPDAAAPWATL